MAAHTIDKETAILRSRIADCIEESYINQKPSFVGFLSEGEISVAVAELRKQHAFYTVFGGYEGCERAYVGIFPYETDDVSLFPISVLKIQWNDKYVLTHRDILGTFMSLLIKRETIGDIIVHKSEAFAFVSENISKVILSDVSKIKNIGVTITPADYKDVLIKREFEKITGTLSSLRLDCAVSFLANCSRSAADELISGGKVFLNSVEQNCSDKKIAPGDKISIRGTGKFCFIGKDGITKKDKLKVSFNKYI